MVRMCAVGKPPQTRVQAGCRDCATLERECLGGSAAQRMTDLELDRRAVRKLAAHPHISAAIDDVARVAGQPPADQVGGRDPCRCRRCPISPPGAA